MAPELGCGQASAGGAAVKEHPPARSPGNTTHRSGSELTGATGDPVQVLRGDGDILEKLLWALWV